MDRTAGVQLHVILVRVRNAIVKKLREWLDFQTVLLRIGVILSESSRFDYDEYGLNHLFLDDRQHRKFPRAD